MLPISLTIRVTKMLDRKENTENFFILKTFIKISFIIVITIS